jgi:DnaJ-class molecular chaperone
MEIRALVKILDELDYYQILHLAAQATQTEVKKAYFQTSRIFHPDANRHLEPELRGECSHISKRVTEAYCVLRDPRRRAAYDAQRAEEDGKQRMQLAEARATHARKDSEERQGKTPQGRQFFQKASAQIDRGDTAGAINNLQMALTFEPRNDYFKSLLAELKQQP